MTTNSLTLAAVRAIKEEAENLIGNEGVVSPYVIKRTTEAIPALCDSIETLVEALRSIAQHPHCDYGYPSSQSGDMQYAIGVADGHRCAANVARATLSTIDPRSAEAQTEGDGG